MQGNFGQFGGMLLSYPETLRKASERVEGENGPNGTPLGHPKFAGTNFGWFGATFEFWSIFAILTSERGLGVPPDSPILGYARPCWG